MTGSVIVFGPHRPGDNALDNSRWIAAKHIDRLAEWAIPVVDDKATRDNLEATLQNGLIDGIVLCGHGDGGKEFFLLHCQHQERNEDWHKRYNKTSELGAVRGSDDAAAFDHENLPHAAKRWVHVLACEVGLSKLPENAREIGVVFVSYTERLVPEFTTSTLPLDAARILAHIVTLTTTRLCERQFDENHIAGGVRRAREDLLEWFDSDAGYAWVNGDGSFLERIGLTKFTTQLSSALRVVMPNET